MLETFFLSISTSPIQFPRSVTSHGFPSVIIHAASPKGPLGAFDAQKWIIGEITRTERYFFPKGVNNAGRCRNVTQRRKLSYICRTTAFDVFPGAAPQGYVNALSACSHDRGQPFLSCPTLLIKKEIIYHNLFLRPPGFDELSPMCLFLRKKRGGNNRRRRRRRRLSREEGDRK